MCPFHSLLLIPVRAKVVQLSFFNPDMVMTINSATLALYYYLKAHFLSLRECTIDAGICLEDHEW